jgi:hypothetical protein
MSLQQNRKVSFSDINKSLSVTNGNTGIGTTAPSHTLDVNGGLRSTNFTTANALITNVTTTTLSVSSLISVSDTANAPAEVFAGRKVEFISGGLGYWHQLVPSGYEGRPYYYSSSYFVTALPVDPTPGYNPYSSFYNPTAFKYTGSSSAVVNWRVQTPGASAPMMGTYTIYVDILDTDGTTIISTPATLVYSSGSLVTDTGIETTTLNQNQYIRFRGSGTSATIEDFIFTYDLSTNVSGLIASSSGITTGTLKATSALMTNVTTATLNTSKLTIQTPDPAVNFSLLDFRNPNYGIYAQSDSINARGNTLRFLATDYNTNNVTTRDILTMRPEGNVGINTSSPSFPLDVNGTIRSRSSINNANGISIENPNTGSSAYSIITLATDQVSNFNIFKNSTTRTSDGGANTVTIRNDGGAVRLMSNTGSGMLIDTSGNVTVYGALSKGSGTFDIQHPLHPNDKTKHLVHSFIEGPRCDLIYRGEVQLVNGTATINIDSDCVAEPGCEMTQGTFEALCANPHFFLQNPSSFSRLKGNIQGNILTIECEDQNSSDIVYWSVIAERKDNTVKEWNRTNENGYLITEYEKEDLHN